MRFSQFFFRQPSIQTAVRIDRQWQRRFEMSSMLGQANPSQRFTAQELPASISRSLGCENQIVVRRDLIAHFERHPGLDPHIDVWMPAAELCDDLRQDMSGVILRGRETNRAGNIARPHLGDHRAVQAEQFVSMSKEAFAQ
jgi:hypothetical protein